MTSFDLALCLDLRRSDAEAERIGALIDALARRKARIGVLPVMSAAQRDRGWAAPILRRFETGAARLIDASSADDARIAVIDDIGAVIAPATPTPRLRAAGTILRMGARFDDALDQLDPIRLASNARDLVGGDLTAAPPDPEARRRLAAWAPHWPLTPWDWRWTDGDGDAAAAHGGLNGSAPRRRATWPNGGRPTLLERGDRRALDERIDALADLLLDWPAAWPPQTARATLSTPTAIARPPAPRRHVLFLSPNGVGLGHLTRLLAIARRLPRRIEPVFLTMSYGARVVEDYGFLAEFTPRVADRDWWIEGLRATLNQLIEFYDVQAVVCDLNVPYSGLLRARRDAPEIPFVWIRRGMWRAHHGLDAAERERGFDVVIEPGDYAFDYDRGVTATRGERARRTPPIVLLDPDEILDRSAARRALDLPEDQTFGLVMLGSGVNFDMATVEARVADFLQSRPKADFRILRWMNAHRDAPAVPEAAVEHSVRSAAEIRAVGVGEARTLSAFPAAQYFNAFDFAVSAVGYNSFHELLRNRTPTIFVPNENPMMDDQDGRALFAERRGLALQLRRSTLHRTDAALARIMDPEERAILSDRCATLPPADGARAAAQIIAELVDGVRSLHPLDGLARR